MTLRGLSLCSGYGGLDLAVDAVLDVQWQAFAEFDANAARVFSSHWPGLPNLGDITAVDWTSLGRVDVLTAGYPCQPFSSAGKRLGDKDERHIWPFIADAVRVLRPRWVLLENVAGHLRLGFDRVLADLAGIGFDAEWTLLRASEVGAPHGRARLFIAAFDPAVIGRRWPTGQLGRMGAAEPVAAHQPLPDPASTGRRRPGSPVREGATGAGSPGQPSRDDQGPAADTQSQRRSEGRSEPDRRQPATDAARASADTDGAGGEAHGRRPGARDAGRREPVVGGGAPAADSAGTGARGDEQGLRQEHRRGSNGAPTDWGDYAPAIARWERIVGRPAPDPLDERGRLNPRLPEWMMGLPDGWVTDILPRSPALKCIGNGVCPQQAAHAFRHLLGRADLEAAA